MLHTIIQMVVFSLSLRRIYFRNIEKKIQSNLDKQENLLFIEYLLNK